MMVELTGEKREAAQAMNRAESLEEYVKRLEEELGRLRQGFELEKLQVVAEETRKARLIRQLDELERASSPASKLEKEHGGVKNTAAAVDESSDCPSVIRLVHTHYPCEVW